MTKSPELELDENYLREVEARVHDATPGPWVSFWEGRNLVSGSSFIRTATEDIELSGASMHDQDFIAHARQDIPRLLAEVRRLRQILGHQTPRS